MKYIHRLSKDILVKGLAFFMCCVFCIQPFLSPITTYAQEALVEATANNADCYISNFAIKGVKDGTATFDADDAVGNDSSDSNQIVRSFDYINYDLEYVTAISNPSKVVDSAYVFIEFSLNKDPSEAVFNADTFLWCEDAKTTYFYEDGTTSTTWDKTKRVEKQVLTGKRKITNNAEINAIPGVGTLSFGVYVKGAQNNDVIQPTFKCWIEGNDESLIQECQGTPIRVSAAPRYNIRLQRNSTGGNADPLLYVSPDKTQYSSEAQDGWMKGRMEGYSILVQLYNSSVNKGLKGIELPSGDITFDIVLSETVNGTDVTDQAEYTPQLWDWRLNNPGQKGTQGKAMSFFGDNYTSANYGVPYGISNKFSRSYNQTWDSGDYTIVDNGDHTYSVTLKDYSFDVDQYYFPYSHIHGSSKTYTYGENVGNFSVGFAQFLCQFPEEVDTTSNLQMNARIENMNFTSISGQTTNTDMVESDNEANTQVTLYPRGSYSSRDIFNGSSAYGRGDASVALGEVKTLNMSFSYAGDEPITSWNFLQKFDDTRFSLASDISINHKGNWNNQAGEVTILYAAKPDKSGWKNDEEQNTAKEENLIYFKTLKELEDKGYTCVGFLVEVRDGLYYSTDGTASLSVNLKVNPNAEAGTVGMVKESSRAWSTDASPLSWTSVSYNNNSDIFGLGSAETDWGAGKKYYEGYEKPRFDFNISYKKTEYKEGTVSGGHTGGYLAGNSLLLVGDVTNIKVSTKDGKTSYDMDNNERTVTYVLSPTLQVASKNLETSEANMTDTVYISATLPKELKYKPGTASIEPSEVIESETETIIRWVLPNLKVGQDIEKITFDAAIGKAGTKEDVQNTQQISISSKISSDMDNRQQIIENGNYSETSINIIKLATSSISKTVDKEYQEAGQDFTYSLNLGNTSEIEIENARMYDVLPHNNDGRGTSYSGDYQVKTVTLNYEDASETWKTNKEKASVKATSDTSYQETERQSEVLTSSLDANWKTISQKQVNETDKTIMFTLEDADATALYFDIGGNLFGNEFVTVEVTCSPLDSQGNYLKDTENNIQQAGDTYVNSFYQYADNQIAIVQSNIAKTQVVRRSLSGLVWIDENQNGIQDKNEEKIKGKKISLYRYKASAWDTEQDVIQVGNQRLYRAYTVSGQKIKDVTLQEDGNYQFTDLEEGDYAVVLNNVEQYMVTNQHIGDNTEVDNDSLQGEMNGDQMVSAIISSISLPTLANMTSSTYESKFNDFGLYRVMAKPVTFNKVWEDDENRDGIRPESITVLVKGGDIEKEFTISSKEEWQTVLNDLPKYDDSGNLIDYTIEEKSVNGYTSKILGNLEQGFTLTNTHEIETVTVSVQKQWEDDNNRDGLRPDKIRVRLLANGIATGQEKEVKSDSGWKTTFTNLPKYEDGNLIDYTIEEVDTSDGYTVDIKEAKENNFVLTNTHSVTLKDISVNKIWDDENNQDGIRPEAVQVGLYANEKCIDKVTLDASNQWKHTFADIYVYENKKEIQYEVRELDVPFGYIDSVEEKDDVWTITNTHSPNKINISGRKTWDDDNNRDGVRPESIEVQLYANGTLLDTKTVDESTSWKYQFKDLDANQNGTQIVYSIEEVAVDGYQTEIQGFNIQNSHENGKTSVNVRKTWEDADNQDGIRPDSVLVHLFANGNDTGKTLTLNDECNWQGTFTDLLENENGQAIQYSVQEEPVNGYSTDIQQNENGVWEIINSHIPEKIDLSVEKQWNDDDNRDGIRPDAVTIHLYKNGIVYDTIELSEENEWRHVFTECSKYENGKEIIWTVDEDNVKGYTKDIETMESGFVVKNTHAPLKKTLTVQKYWDDGEDADKLRPDTITVEVLANDVVLLEQEISKEDDWKIQISDVFQYENQEEIQYEIREKEVAGYQSSIECQKDTWTITNTHTPKKVVVAPEEPKETPKSDKKIQTGIVTPIVLPALVVGLLVAGVVWLRIHRMKD